MQSEGWNEQRLRGRHKSGLEEEGSVEIQAAGREKLD